MKLFNSIEPEAINDNVFKLMNEDWMLITAGKKDSFNTMTASWGNFGILWHKPIATIFVRPTRYTFQFLENNHFFTLSFFDEKHRNILNDCGNKSGRNVNKIKLTGLIPLETPKGNIFFEQARLVIECKKLYFHDLHPDQFLDDKIEKNYPQKDYHRMYIGEIVSCLLADEK